MAAAYPEEYILYSLPAAALSQVLPLLSQLLAGWQPLVDPSVGVEQFRAWKGLLEGEGSRQAVLGSWEDSEDPYGLLVMELVLPPIRYDTLPTHVSVMLLFHCPGDQCQALHGSCNAQSHHEWASRSC